MNSFFLLKMICYIITSYYLKMLHSQEVPYTYLPSPSTRVGSFLRALQLSNFWVIFRLFIFLSFFKIQYQYSCYSVSVFFLSAIITWRRVWEWYNAIYYMPSTFYIVKLPLALGNIFNLTESIMAQSHDDAKNPYWGLIMDFWHCLKVMTYKNRALFRVEQG